MLFHCATGGRLNFDYEFIVCEQSEWLGIRLNPEANARHDVVISAGDSSVDVLVIPTNEEWMMAHHAQTLLAL